MNLPNLLTITRIALIPVFAWCILTERFLAAFIVFAIGSVTDALDGFIARRFDQVTALGQALDPVADKLFLLTSYTAAYMANLLPLYLLLATWLKELVVISGYILLCKVLSRKIEINPNILGKGATLFQMLTLLALMSAGLGFISGDGWIHLLFGTTVFMIAASTADYVMTGVRLYLNRDVYE